MLLGTMGKPEPAGTFPPILFGAEPYRITIGVTGHRKLRRPDLVRQAVDASLADLDVRLNGIPHCYTILSPLADGADRLAATSVLAWDGRGSAQAVRAPELDVVLPMAVDEYVRTFEQDDEGSSASEFRALLARATQAKTLEGAPSHKAAYEQVGHYVVDNCDILIAIWDGKQARGRGGTGEVVDLARRVCRSVICIDPASGAKKVITTPRGFLNQIDRVKEYMSESDDDAKGGIAEDVERRFHKLARAWEAEGLRVNELQPLKRTMLPHLAKASALAKKYQLRYFNSIVWACALNAAAVLCAAIGALFFPREGMVFLTEATLIVFATVLAWPSTFEAQQRKWIDYRYLAERLRSSCFLHLAEMQQDYSETPSDLELSSLPENWADVVIRDVWQSTPPVAHSFEEEETGAERHAKVSAFLRRAWIDEQKKYYDKAAQRNHRSRERLEITLKVMLAITLLIASSHALMDGLWPELEERSAMFSRVMSLMAVTLPAVASALVTVSVFRNFSRNAERYENMSRHLESVSRRMSTGDRNSEGMQGLLREANAAMMHEHRSWRAVFGVREPRPS
jgi:SMODS and SLOG-associating 2TM effector domain 1